MLSLAASSTTSLFLILVLNAWIISTNGQSLFGGQCPDKCSCFLDDRGYMEVRCSEGRMTEIPTIRMSPSTEVIRIVPPVAQPNQLTIGRFFKQFKKLVELHIVNSNIPNIGEHSFWGVQSLRVLNLTQNNISLIIEPNFKGLVSLETLSLSHNKIDSFVSASFSSLVKLNKLDLSWNRATKLVERLFYNLHLLEELDLSGNWLRELSPDVFRDVWRLKKLKCAHCGLKTINPLLYALLTDLRVLDLSDNEFKYLNKEEFGSLIHLKELYLNSNQLSAITDDTFRSQNFFILSLASNRIARIDRGAFLNSTIGNLDLSGNKFDILDAAIFTHTVKKNLTHLNLSKNPKLTLGSLSQILSENTQLRNLSLNENKLEELPLNIFEKLRRLEILSLSGNYLADIFPHHLTALTNLRILDLSNNRLKGMDYDVLSLIDGFYSFKELKIGGNPWACDLCNIPFLLKWVKVHPVFSKACSTELYSEECLRCVSPPTLYDRPLVSLEEPNLEWCNNAEPASILASDPKFGLFIALALILSLCLILISAIILHSKWHAAHYYTHEEERPEIGPPPIPSEFDPAEGDENFYYGTNGAKYNHKDEFYNEKEKSRMIATIEEVGPGEGVFKNNTHHSRKSSYPPQLTSFKNIANSRPNSDISPNLNNRHIEGNKNFIST